MRKFHYLNLHQVTKYECKGFSTTKLPHLFIGHEIGDIVRESLAHRCLHQLQRTPHLYMATTKVMRGTIERKLHERTNRSAIKNDMLASLNTGTAPSYI